MKFIMQLFGKQLEKLMSRTEWQAFLVAVATLFLNRFFELGLTEHDITALFGGATGYAVSRGLAKKPAAVAATKD